jgi:hypothetical protein
MRVDDVGVDAAERAPELPHRAQILDWRDAPEHGDSVDRDPFTLREVVAARLGRRDRLEGDPAGSHELRLAGEEAQRSRDRRDVHDGQGLRRLVGARGHVSRPPRRWLVMMRTLSQTRLLLADARRPATGYRDPYVFRVH